MSESHIKPYVWDQLELVRMLTDLYIKNKDTKDGHNSLNYGMLGEQASMGLKKAINVQMLELTNFISKG